MDDQILNKRLHEAMTGKGCICPTLCDCENADAGLVSNECPIHNVRPMSVEGCPVHDDGGDVPAYDTDLPAAFDLVEWMRKKGAWVYIRGGSDNWQVEIGKDAHATDESLPKAISLACAKALGITGE